jgi:phosphoribosylcarboxyaminoimidazole (NCAIR) mutase
VNAALLAVRILANNQPELREKLRAYHTAMAEKVARETLS